MKTTKALTLLICIALCNTLSGQDYPFRNTNLSFEERAADIVSRLTLEEKVMQMLNDAPAIDRLNIPSYNWWNECLHGIGRTEYKVTVFPQAIGMAAAWDTKLIEEVAGAISDEGRAIYNDASSKGNRAIYHGLTYWTPNINIFRDPRWGRGQETYGEDPFLTGSIGKAFVKGLQGDDPKYLKAAACAKHYAVHSGPENTRHTFNTFVTTFDLWDTYLPAFRDLVVDAKVAGVMCAYNAYSGEPCCGNNLLMQEILRDKWGFTGYVTSDCGAIDDFYRHHKTHPDAKYASADAVFHGTDLDCGRDAYRGLVDAVKMGLITEAQIDTSLKRLFIIRLRLGLFDPAENVKYANIPISVLESSKHKELARKITRESIVLLKNENNFLPLNKKMKKVAVIGPNANNEVSVLGNYSGFPTEIMTPYKAIKKKLPKAEVIYEKGIEFVTPSENSGQDIAALVDRMKGMDMVVFVGGISPELEGEEMPVNIEGFTGGDRTSIKLPKIQTDLMKALKAANIPTVFVMMTGSAIATEWESANIPAIINAWYGGQDAGTAIADVLFGDYNPSGKLPVTFYAKDSDLSAFNSYEMKNRTYRYFDGQVLYPFGYGLSYTDFEYSSVQIPSSIKAGESIEVTVNVKNTGKIDGGEVVQLYMGYPTAKEQTPLYTLKAFNRIFLKAGESKNIVFRLSPKEFALAEAEGILKVKAGKRKLYIGGTSPSKTNAQKLPVVEKEFNITGQEYIINNQ
ncbi:glycoside hydrolase family 3 C-terminal domain-containing protein [Prevotella sp. 10(H)]|uniref:glycoside hydrolase family 3 C-terminal domain-containing protein n=1 Tax=Prevotella sp. 10(H) TaxID=1158294 RepID=UPI0004A753CF|nr:glycoside hydrolase family 3 C-terminal domain-containing protein [Prevotella sp. 10(H)]